VEHLEEAIELIADAAFAQVQQHRHQMGQRERSFAREIRCVHAGRGCELIGKQEISYGGIEKFKFD
jgi:hypothetical protein